MTVDNQWNFQKLFYIFISLTFYIMFLPPPPEPAGFLFPILWPLNAGPIYVFQIPSDEEQEFWDKVNNQLEENSNPAL